MPTAHSSVHSSGAKSSGKAWMGVAVFATAVGALGLQALGGSSSLMSAEAPATGATFISECMEAELLWREGSPGWYQAATTEERAGLRRSCNAAFNRGKPTEAMLAVREGRALVRAGGIESATAGPSSS